MELDTFCYLNFRHWEDLDEHFKELNKFPIRENSIIITKTIWGKLWERFLWKLVKIMKCWK